MRLKSQKLLKEAKAFDNIVKKRVIKGFDPYIHSNKINNFFYNNPWRYPLSKKLSVKKKLDFVLSECKKNNKVLEVGCGLGTLSMELAKKNIKVLAIDISEKSLKYAKKFSRKNLDKKDYENINFKKLAISDIYNNKNLKFDKIIFFKTLHHLPNVDNLMKKIKINLKKNGKIIIVEPFRSEFKYLNAVIAYIIRKLSTTWINKKKKMKNNSTKTIENEINNIFKEYKYIENKRGFDQSPMDNVTSSLEKVLKALKKNYSIKKISYQDAFKDKIIGGIYGDNKENEIKFIDNLDNFLIKKKILPGSTAMIVAQKK